MAENFVRCPNCDAKNRMGTADSARERPRCGRCGAPLPWLVEATDATFDHEADAPMPVLVDLWAPWCGPCRMVAPVLEELSRELAGKIKVVKVNVDENPSLSQRFGAQSIPMLVLVRGDRTLETVVGAQPKAALHQLVKPHL